MKNSKSKLIRDQLDNKFIEFQLLRQITIPQTGWIYAIRTALNMSLKQLGNRLGITPQSVKEIEMREQDASITLRALNEVANVLNLQLIYVLMPKDKSLQAMVEKAAFEAAKKIVMRTSISMKLEDQENTEERILKAVKDKTEDIIREMPKYIWD